MHNKLRETAKSLKLEFPGLVKMVKYVQITRPDSLELEAFTNTTSAPRLLHSLMMRGKHGVWNVCMGGTFVGVVNSDRAVDRVR